MFIALVIISCCIAALTDNEIYGWLFFGIGLAIMSIVEHFTEKDAKDDRRIE